MLGGRRGVRDVQVVHHLRGLVVQEVLVLGIVLRIVRVLGDLHCGRFNGVEHPSVVILVEVRDSIAGSVSKPLTVRPSEYTYSDSA